MRFLVSWYCGNQDRVTIVDADGPFGLNEAMTNYLYADGENQPDGFGGEVQINSAVQIRKPASDAVEGYVEENEDFPIYVLHADRFDDSGELRQDIPIWDLTTI